VARAHRAPAEARSQQPEVMMYEYEYIINNAASSLEAELLALQVFWRLSTTQRTSKEEMFS